MSENTRAWTTLLSPPLTEADGDLGDHVGALGGVANVRGRLEFDPRTHEVRGHSAVWIDQNGASTRVYEAERCRVDQGRGRDRRNFANHEAPDEATRPFEIDAEDPITAPGWTLRSSAAASEGVTAR